METAEWRWTTSDGVEIYSKAWIPSGKAKAVVCVLHGVGEHIGRYQAAGEAMAQAGYVQAGFDQRGFGKSGGRRGHTPSLEAYFDDIDMFLREVGQRYPGLPRFLYGMSMGGVLVLAYTPVRQPALAGVIAAGPGLKTSLEEQKVKVLLARLLGQLVPTLTLNSGVDPQEISRDPQVIEAFLKDPLVHFLVTAAWGRSMLRAVGLVFENAPRFPLPLLIMHGTKDTIAYPRGSQAFAELAPKDKVTLKMWDGFKHDLHTDPEKAEVFKTMIQWMDRQMLHQS
ncbi:MAG: lysophospholipase [Chloroflexi bacterium]|nr:lysophospholipase [Chloroflexota bacterium]